MRNHLFPSILMRSQKRRSLGWLQQPFQIQPGKPAYAYGIRILLILIGPVAVGFAIGNPKVSVIPTLAALSVGLITVGGTYRKQAKAMGAAAIAVTLALLLANLVGDSLLLRLAATFVLTFALSFASLWGAGVTGISITTLLMFIVSLAKFSTFSDPSVLLQQCLLCFAGGLWAMVVSSLLWIVRPYTPVSEAVAGSYLALSALAESLSQGVSHNRVQNGSETKESDSVTKDSQAKKLARSQDAAIQKLSFARDIWTSAWATEKTGSSSHSQGNRLLAFIEDANQINHSLVALTKLIETAASNPFFQHLRPEVEQSAAQIAIALQNISAALKQKQPHKGCPFH